MLGQMPCACTVTWLLALLTLRLAATGMKPAIRVEISVDGREFLFSGNGPNLKIEQIANERQPEAERPTSIGVTSLQNG